MLTPAATLLAMWPRSAISFITEWKDERTLRAWSRLQWARSHDRNDTMSGV